MADSYFSDTYQEARRRFRRAAEDIGAALQSYPVPAAAAEELTIDVATIGDERAPTVITSSGVHGVEGYLGSAIQLALLERLAQHPAPQIRHVLIHAINPFGFAECRRFNEDNIDLNRNFLSRPEEYRGAPDGYAALDSFLNPPSPPTRFEPFRIKAAWQVWRLGLQAVKQTVAAGQYAYPKGVFFGGHGPATSTRIVFEHSRDWLAEADQLVHLDFHSGLGRYGECRLLLSEQTDTHEVEWYQRAFGTGCVEARPPADTPGTAYVASGTFGAWLQEEFRPREYRFVTAEYGTFDPIRVLGALRAENRAFHYATDRDHSLQHRVRAELLECFCPADPQWRKTVVATGLQLVQQSEHALRRGDGPQA